MTIPSVATFSPGRTTNSSPTASCAAGTRTSCPARSAAPDRRFARASRCRPSRTSTVTPAATSRYVDPVPVTSAASDHRYAAVALRLISVSMVATPCRAFPTAARWKGHAPHSATGVASASDSHAQGRDGQAMASTTTGTASTKEISSRGGKVNEAAGGA